MSAERAKIALTGLQWTLGLVILIEAVLFVLPGAAHAFAKRTCRTLYVLFSDSERSLAASSC